ncbi:hypothetical protein ACWCYL_18065 [Streptomyces sp. 900105755]
MHSPPAARHGPGAAALLQEPRTAGRILELISAPTPTDEAVRAVVGG